MTTRKGEESDEPATPRIHVLQDKQIRRQPATSDVGYREELLMIVVNCTHCQKRRLLDLNSLTSLDNTGVGIRVTYQCSCRGHGSMLLD